MFARYLLLLLYVLVQIFETFILVQQSSLCDVDPCINHCLKISVSKKHYKVTVRMERWVVDYAFLSQGQHGCACACVRVCACVLD